MRLNYNTTIPSDPAPLVMSRAERERVEIYLHPDEEGLITLFAFAGGDGQPERSTAQGPFYRMEQAVGARRAIADSLLEQGYRLDPQRHTIWALQAQRELKQLRESHKSNAVDYRFDPKDVFLDW